MAFEMVQGWRVVAKCILYSEKGCLRSFVCVLGDFGWFLVLCGMVLWRFLFETQKWFWIFWFGLGFFDWRLLFEGQSSSVLDWFSLVTSFRGTKLFFGHFFSRDKIDF